MSTFVAVIVLQGYIAAGRRWVRAHAPSGDAGSALELVIITLGLIAVAVLLVAAITAAVQRRVDQIT